MLVSIAEMLIRFGNDKKSPTHWGGVAIGSAVGLNRGCDREFKRAAAMTVDSNPSGHKKHNSWPQKSIDKKSQVSNAAGQQLVESVRRLRPRGLRKVLEG